MTVATQGFGSLFRFGEGVSSGGSGLRWDPSGAQGDVTTWNEVMTAVSVSKTPLAIWGTPGQVHEIPSSGTPYDMKNSKFVMNVGDNEGARFNIQDGATVMNLVGLQGSFDVVGNSTNPTTPSLDWSLFHNLTGGPAPFIMEFGANIRNEGSAPMIVMPDNAFLIFASLNGGGIGQSMIPPAPVIAMGQNGILLLTCVGSSIQLQLDCISGPATCNIGGQHDGCLIPPPPGALPSYAGGIFNLPFGIAAGEGPTSFRPIGAFSPLRHGTQYFDTDINLPIWWDAVAMNWYDANHNGPV